jgi:hypothetical protein
MDSEEYLRRFFDLEYTIPKPDMTSVIDWMLEKYSFKQLEQNIQFEEYRFLRKLAVEYFKNSDLPIRFVEKLFLQIRLALATIKPNEAVFSEQLFVLILVKFFEPELYNEIKNNSFSNIEFLNSINNFINFNQNLDEIFSLKEIEAKFVFLYSNNLKNMGSNKLIKETDSRKYTLLYEPKFDKSDNYSYTIEALNEFKKSDISKYSLDYIIQKIELINPIQN